MQVGVHQELLTRSSSDLASDVKLAQALNAGVSRFLCYWPIVQSVNAGTFDWSKMDAALAALDAAKIPAVACLAGFPTWLSGYVGEWTLQTLAADQAASSSAYATFCGAAATRYKGRRWELWNEQNEGNFLSLPPDDQTARTTVLTWYGGAYLAARSAILTADPTARVSVGGVTGLGASGFWPNSGNVWLQDLVTNVGASNVDTIAIHPYTSSVSQGPNNHIAFSQNFDDIGLIHSSFPSARLWVTEFGWPSTSPNSEAVQATFCGQALANLATTFPYCELACWFIDCETSGATGYGLYQSDFVTPKLAGRLFGSSEGPAASTRALQGQGV